MIETEKTHILTTLNKPCKILKKDKLPVKIMKKKPPSQYVDDNGNVEISTIVLLDTQEKLEVYSFLVK